MLARCCDFALAAAATAAAGSTGELSTAGAPMNDDARRASRPIALLLAALHTPIGEKKPVSSAWPSTSGEHSASRSR